MISTKEILFCGTIDQRMLGKLTWRCCMRSRSHFLFLLGIHHRKKNIETHLQCASQIGHPLEIEPSPIFYHFSLENHLSLRFKASVPILCLSPTALPCDWSLPFCTPSVNLLFLPGAFSKRWFITLLCHIQADIWPHWSGFAQNFLGFLPGVFLPMIWSKFPVLLCFNLLSDMEIMIEAKAWKTFSP